MTRYTRRIDQGLCGTCGTQREPETKTVCNACKEKTRLRAIDKRAKAAAESKCSSCYKRPNEEGKSKCSQCLNAAAASQRRKAGKRKRAGLCPSCGEPVMPDKVVCAPCSRRTTETSAKRYHERRAAGKCSYCDNDPVDGLTMCQYHIDQTKQQRANLKREVMNAYGGPKCSWCDETNIDFLEIDHIDGGGRQHMKKIKVGSGHNLRGWLKANNFPPGFRILCRTCNNKAHVDKCRERGTKLTANHATTTQ